MNYYTWLWNTAGRRPFLIISFFTINKQFSSLKKRYFFYNIIYCSFFCGLCLLASFLNVFQVLIFSFFVFIRLFQSHSDDFTIIWCNLEKPEETRSKVFLNTENVSANILYLLCQHVVLSFGRGWGEGREPKSISRIII